MRSGKKLKLNRGCRCSDSKLALTWGFLIYRKFMLFVRPDQARLCRTSRLARAWEFFMALGWALRSFAMDRLLGFLPWRQQPRRFSHVSSHRCDCRAAACSRAKALAAPRVAVPQIIDRNVTECSVRKVVEIVMR
jgi:hypothetical protein